MGIAWSSEKASRLKLLSHRNFLLLWLGQLASQFGDRLTQLVLIAIVAANSLGSTLSLAKVLVISSLPALIVSPFAGAYVDRWDRKRTMITCDLIRAAVIVSLPALASLSNPAPLYLGVFVLFAVASFFVPARLAMIPDVVSPAALSQANALFTTSGMIGSTVIMVVGALLVEWVGIQRSCWVNAASYLTSAAWIAPILRQRSARSEVKASTAKILREIIEGIQQLWHHRETRRTMGLLAALTAGAGAATVAATVLVQRWLGSVTRDLGFLSLWIGVGMLLGAMAHGRWGTRLTRQRVLGLSFLGCGVALFGFVGTVVGLRSGVAASAVAALFGFWVAPVGIVVNTLIHEGHPERLHGRIFSSLGVVVNAALIVSMLLAGYLVDRGGKGLLLMAIGGTFAFSGLGSLWYTKISGQRSNKETF